MNIFLSTQMRMVYTLDSNDELMFRKISKSESCFNLNIDDFDLLVLDNLNQKRIINSFTLKDYLEDIKKYLIKTKYNTTNGDII